LKTYRKSNNIIKMCSKNRKIYIGYKDFSLIDKKYFKDMISPLIIEQSKNYIILTGIGYYINVLCFDNLDLFLEGCCGSFGLGLDREEILKYDCK